MTNLLLIWCILAVFEVAIFSSYTLITYIYSKKLNVAPDIDYLPKITFVIPMFNERKVIKEKIINTANIEYPEDKINVIILDDHSTDDSKDISLETIEEIGLDANLIESKGGKGKAKALNWLFQSLENEITVISDADALLKEDSLLQITKNFVDPDIGAATGKIVILSDKKRISKSQEDSYRYFFDIWRLGESNIQSVSICNGPLMSFRTDLLKKIEIDPETYADDSDMFFKIIRRGYRAIYDPEAIVFERVPLSIKGRLVQKMKRINGLRRVYLKNLDLLGRGPFGKIVYPYALLINIVSPVFLLFLIILYPLVALQNPLFYGILLFLLVPRVGGTLVSFLITQLMMNFSFLVPTSGSWKAIEDARYKIDTSDR